MPIIKSARKRVRVAQKATIRNAKTKRQYKSAVKSLSKKPTSEGVSKAQSAIDKAAKKHVIHKNKAARLKSRVAKLANASQVKPLKKAVKIAATKKPAVKPKAAKKAPSKKK
jgi:small subunit ribosomal protein S20